MHKIYTMSLIMTSYGDTLFIPIVLFIMTSYGDTLFIPIVLYAL